MIRRLPFGGAAAGLAALLAGPPALAAERSTPIIFDQPGQPLARALLAVSERAGVVVLAPSVLVAGRAAPALRGSMTLETALRTLLAKTPLDFVVGADGVVTIVPASPKARTVSRPSPMKAPTPPRTEEDEPSEVDTVRVLASAGADQPASLRRRTPSPIDILTDEEIARSGALSLGDALRDLPGASAVPDGGETRQIAIRGVSGRFTRVRINGMETLATFGGANAGGGTNRGRSFDYNVFAADLFKQIRLQKTASADVDEGSLGSTIDIRTRSPFDLPDRSALFYVEQTYNSRSERVAPRGSVVLSRRLADDRLGVLVSAAYSRRYAVDAGSTAGGWQSGDALYPGFGSTTGGASLDEVNRALHARIPRLELMTASQSRLGLTTSLDWRPSARTRISLDLLYASLESKRNEYLLESFTFRTAGACGPTAPPACGLNAVTAINPVITQSRPGLPVLIAGRFDGVDVKSEARYDELDTIFRQTTLSVKQQLPGGVEAALLAGFSRSDFSNPVQNTLHLDQYGVKGFTYDFRDRTRPVVGYGDAVLDQASHWTLSEFRDDPNWVDNSFKTAGLDLRGALPAGLEWRAGLLHKDYRTKAVTLTRSNGTIANLNGEIPAVIGAVPIAAYTRLVGAGASFGAVAPPSSWLAPDVVRALDLLRKTCAAARCDAFRLGPEPVAATNYTIGELDDAAYVLLSRPRSPGRRFWGDVGLRLARTAQASHSPQVQNDGALSPVSAKRSYNDLLPSANLVWEASPDLVLRFGAAKVMARPDLPDLRSLRPGFTISTTSLKALSAGDPDLRPTHATNLDLTAEWFSKGGAVVSVAAYHKSIASIVQQTITQPALFSSNPYGLPDSVAVQACAGAVGCDPALPIWQFVRPANTGKGRLDGLEVSAAAPLGAPGSALASWRLQGSLAYTRSKVLYRMPSGVFEPVEDALGGPRVVGNLTLIYDGRRWDARVGVSYRGRYLSAIPALTGGDSEGFAALSILDASFRYKLSPQLTLAADLNNLTDVVMRQFVDRSEIPNYQHRTGRDVRVGLRFRYN
jgi:iron complex outermembrane receptor protein